MQNIGIYVHLPFCVQKCNYCDFLSAPADKTLRELYMRALMGQIASVYEEDYNENHAVDTIYFGGGTPSLISPEWIGKILETIKKYFVVKPDAEISMECNPGTVDEEKLRAFYELGINRLSIGLQSTNDELLKKLGRIHTLEDFLVTYRTARSVGFSNINIDIMSALPDQSVDDYEETLDIVLALKPEHISAYSLIIEPGTPFSEMELNLPDEDADRQMYHITKQRLSEHGYERYEISNYSKPGFECRHNNIYWTGRDYLGFGIGAASLDRGMRYSVIRDRDMYIDLALKGKWSELYTDVTRLTQKDLQNEFCILGLRRCAGISPAEFYFKFGVKLSQIYGEAIEKYKKLGMLVAEHDRVWLTDEGIDVSNVILADFMQD